MGADGGAGSIGVACRLALAATCRESCSCRHSPGAGRSNMCWWWHEGGCV